MNWRTPGTLSEGIRLLYRKTPLHRRVTEEVEDPLLRSAYSHCREVTRHYAKTFYLATRFLPYAKQRSIFAIYALCRELDNIVDENMEHSRLFKAEAGRVLDVLSDWKRMLLDTYRGQPSSLPILTALSDVLRRHEIAVDLPLELIDGVTMDLVKNRYESFEEVYEYSYKVASVVGLMVSEIFGYCDKIALDRAVELGIAMQLTNILRDVGEDLARNRIYLPAADLRRFGVREEDLFEHRLTPEFMALMQFQISRARSYYERAEKGIPLLSSDSRITVYLARYNYERILDRIEANGYQVFTRRAFVPLVGKMAVIPRILWQYSRS